MRNPRRKPARGLVALSIIVGITLASTTSVFAMHQYFDVPTDSPFHDDIDWLTDNGIAEGFADGGYHPTAPVSRQAMAAFMHRLYIRTFPQEFDRPFHLYVVCAATTRRAVVAANGTFVRGSAGTTSSRNSQGEYQVNFNIDVSECLFQATVGQTGSFGVASGWATVAGEAADANGVFVATYDVPQS
jgi:hypothetical protein